MLYDLILMCRTERGYLSSHVVDIKSDEDRSFLLPPNHFQAVTKMLDRTTRELANDG